MVYKNGGTIVLTLVDLLFSRVAIFYQTRPSITPNFIYVNFIFNNIYPSTNDQLLKYKFTLFFDTCKRCYFFFNG